MAVPSVTLPALECPDVLLPTPANLSNLFGGLATMSYRYPDELADLKAKSCDLEAWSPRQKKYFEITSLTNMEEAQARRLNIKIEDRGKRYYAHTLNNTVIATSRAIVAIMENNQQKDGSIKIPKALWKYMGGKKVIRKQGSKK